jgi:hypothetical protein
MSKSNFPSATRSIERYMVDTVMIYRPQDLDAMSIDPNTLELIEGEVEILYEGKALVSPMGDPGDQTIGLAVRSTLYYTVALPVMDVQFDPDDVMQVVHAANDSQMQDQTFVVEGEIPSSINVYKRLRARLDVDAS